MYVLFQLYLLGKILPMTSCTCNFFLGICQNDSLNHVENSQVLRDFRHVNPDGDEEAKELQDTNVSIVHLEVFDVLKPRELQLKIPLERYTRLPHDA